MKHEPSWEPGWSQETWDRYMAERNTKRLKRKSKANAKRVMYEDEMTDEEYELALAGYPI